jgi:hypothetical protein
MEHVVNVERMYLDMIYRIKIKRIAKGLSPELVSLTIGREPDYLSQVEMLQTKINNSDELQEIAWVLGEDNVHGFLPSAKDHTMLKVIIADDVFGATHVQRCDILINPEEQVPFYHLQEEVCPRPSAMVN